MRLVKRDPQYLMKGAILVETALSFIFILGLYFAGFQIGIISYYQLALDAGSQVHARATALGYPVADSQSTIKSDTPIPFGKITWPDPATDPESRQPLPTSTGGNGIKTNNIDFNFNNPNGRDGGYSFDAPLPYVVHTSTNEAGSQVAALNIGNIHIVLNSVAVEAQVQELCPHECLISGGIAKATSADAFSYFDKGDNTAPYFMGFNVMLTCGTDPVYDFTQPPAGTPGGSWNWNVCPGGDVTWRAIGTAAHLDESNNYYTQPGETLSSSYNSLTIDPPAANEAGPFFQLWCHRNMYAWIEQAAFPEANPSLTNTSLALHTYLKTWLDKTTNPMKPGAIIYDGEPGSFSATNLGTAAAPIMQVYFINSDAGWDAAQPYNSGYSNVTFNQSQTLPWWGCGVIP